MVDRNGRIAQLVRALASHARGQRFESVYAHHTCGEQTVQLGIDVVRVAYREYRISLFEMPFHETPPLGGVL